MLGSKNGGSAYFMCWDDLFRQTLSLKNIVYVYEKGFSSHILESQTLKDTTQMALI